MNSNRMIAESYAVLGTMYHNGFGVKVNYEISLEFFIKAAELGFVDAMANLVQYYSEGIGCNRDSKKAHKYIMMAIDAGDLECMLQFGSWHMNWI